MNTTQTPEIKSCKCGCGSSVRRNFLPGHDAKLKGRLLTATRSTDWWVREPAVVTMVEQGWGHFVDTTTLAQTPVRGKAHGRFVQSRHIDSFKTWEGYVLDAKGDTHAHRNCPEIQGASTWSRTPDGWLCSTCIHVHDYSEIVWSGRKLQQIPAFEAPVIEEDFDVAA